METQVIAVLSFYDSLNLFKERVGHDAFCERKSEIRELQPVDIVPPQETDPNIILAAVDASTFDPMMMLSAVIGWGDKILRFNSSH